MSKYLLIAALVVAMPAAAELTVVEETETMTVYREGDQVVVLAADGRLGALMNLSQARAPGDMPKVLGQHRIDNKEIRNLGLKLYLTRIRQLDNELVCEKLTGRPKSRDDHRMVVEWLLQKPC